MKILHFCPLCNSKNLRGHSMRLKEHYPHCSRSQCMDCDIVFANPMADDQELTDFYQNYYDAGNFAQDDWKSRTAAFFRENNQLDQQEFTRQHANTLRYYQFGEGKGGRFLDIGCGLGKTTYIASRCGWEVSATEFDGDAITFVKDHIKGINCFQGDFINAGYPENYFDYILLYHVIEHVTDPVAVTNELHRILKPGGRLFIGTPNIDSTGYKIYRASQFLRRKIPGIVDGMEHTFVFNKRRLATLLESAGLSVIYHKAEAHTERLSSILRSKDSIKRKLSRIIQLVFKVNQRLVCRK